MYEQSAKWNAYYDEIDPKQRKVLLDEAIMNEADDGANALRMRLFNMRYLDEKNPQQYVDRFLWQCVNMLLVYKTNHLFKSAGEKDMKKTFAALGFDLVDQDDENSRKAYYWEVRNTIKRYLSTTQNGAYRRKLFGIMSASDEEREVQSLKDIWEMSKGLAEKYHKEAEMALWNQAVYDAYIVSDPQGVANFKAYDESHRRNK